jgi:hypothetical protein
VKRTHCPEFYGLVADTAISYQSEVAPLICQSIPPQMPEQAEADMPERELVAGD